LFIGARVFKILPLLLLFIVFAHRAESSFLFNLNCPDCLKFRFCGFCKKHGVPVAPRWCFYEPQLAIEVVPEPMVSVFAGHIPLEIEGLGRILQIPEGPSKAMPGGMQGAKNFGEVHVFDLGMEYSCYLFKPLCNPKRDRGSPISIIVYASEIDYANWRYGIVDKTLGLTSTAASCIAGMGPHCVGTWGPLYARFGHATHKSDLVASGLLAYRAAHLATAFYGTFPYVLNQWADQMQLGYPTMGPCIHPGWPPALWEFGRKTPSGDGYFLWYYWTPEYCCGG
jgi:hypothetical protein